MANFTPRTMKPPVRLQRVKKGRQKSRLGFSLLAVMLFPGLLNAQTLPKPPKVNDPALRVELIATVPEVEACTTVCGAPDGAIYVGNDPRDGRLNTKEPVCTIVRFSPSTPGVEKRKRTVFAEKLYSPAGSAWHEGWLYVIHDPLMSRFKDANGDGVADVREDLITNLGHVPYEGLNDHCVSGFTLAMDGFFYLSVGDRGIYQAKSARDGSMITMQGGGIVRCRPDGTALEIFSTGTRNHLSVNLDAEDNAFTRDNTDDGNGWWTRLTHHIEGGYYGYPYDYRRAPNYGVTQPSKETLSAIKQFGVEDSGPTAAGRDSGNFESSPAAESKYRNADLFLPAMADFGGGSPTGGLCYLSDGLPEKYRGKHFFSEWGKAGLFVTELARDGATFKLVSDTKLVEPDKGGEFRPVQIAVAADGSLLIADWGYGGWKSPRIAGAVWRLYAPEVKPAPRLADESKASVDELIAALGHPDRDQRLRAQQSVGRRIISENLDPRNAVAAAERLQVVVKIAADKTAPLLQRLHAVWTIAEVSQATSRDDDTTIPLFGRDGVRVLTGSLKDVDPRIRSQAARALSTLLTSTSGDIDRRLREHRPAAAKALGVRLNDAEPVVRLQCATALGRLRAAELFREVTVALSDSDPWIRAAGEAALRRIGQRWYALEPLLQHQDPALRAAALLTLRNVYDQEVVRMLARVAGPENARSSAIAALGGLAYQPKPYDGHWWATQPVKSPPPPNSVAWQGTPQALEALTAAVADADAGVRFASAHAFTQFVLGTGGANAPADPTLALAVGKARSALRARLAAETDPAVRRQLIESLGVQRDPEAVAAFTQIALDEKADPAFRESAIGALVKVGGDGARKAIAQLAAAPLSVAATQRIIAAVGELKLPEVAPALLRYVRGADEKTAAAAVKALGALGSKTWPPDATRTLLLSLNDAPKGVQVAVIEVLAGAKAKDAVPQLIAMIEANQLRSEALAALAAMPDGQSVPVLVAALADKNGGTRRVLLKALKPLREQALPLIEQKLASGAIPADLGPEIRAAFDSGVITKWKMIGPFENVWGAVHPVESDLLGATQGPRASELLARRYPSAEGKEVGWIEVNADAETGHVNLEKLFKTNAMVCAYAFAEIQSAESAEAKLLCGSDDQIAVWLNGKKVHDVSGSRGFEPDKDEVPLPLVAGTNELLVKIGNIGGGWEFAGRIPGVQDGKFVPARGAVIAGASSAPEEKQRAFALVRKPDGSWLHPGSAARGEKLFHDPTASLKGICATCHAVGALGGQIGPNLSLVGGVYPRGDLVTSILEPSKTNALGFEQFMIETNGGETVMGAVRQEAADTITVMGADGKPHTLKKSDIKTRQPLPLSMMPPGLTLGLQPDEFVDLLAYLESLRGQ